MFIVSMWEKMGYEFLFILVVSLLALFMVFKFIVEIINGSLVKVSYQRKAAALNPSSDVIDRVVGYLTTTILESPDRTIVYAWSDFRLERRSIFDANILDLLHFEKGARKVALEALRLRSHCKVSNVELLANYSAIISTLEKMGYDIDPCGAIPGELFPFSLYYEGPLYISQLKSESV